MTPENTDSFCSHHEIHQKLIGDNHEWAKEQNALLFKRTEQTGKEVAVMQEKIHQNTNDINNVAAAARDIPAINEKLHSQGKWIVSLVVLLVGNILLIGYQMWSQ